MIVKARKLKVIVHGEAFNVQLIKNSNGYFIKCTDLLGCMSQRDNEEEALENIKKAIEGYLEVLAKHNFKRKKDDKVVQVSA